MASVWDPEEQSKLNFCIFPLGTGSSFLLQAVVSNSHTARRGNSDCNRWQKGPGYVYLFSFIFLFILSTICHTGEITGVEQVIMYANISVHYFRLERFISRSISP